MTTPRTVILDAVRTPIGRKKGGLSTMHPVDLLGVAQRSVLDRTGIDPDGVGQVVGGCVSQVGEQSFNVTRTAWLAAGLPMTVAATTVDAQCGSGQQAANLAAAMVSGGTTGLTLACGVESMSRIPIGSNSSSGPGRPINRNYRSHYEFVSQFEAAERIARKWGITREDADEFAFSSNARAASAWREQRFASQLVEVDAPVLDEDGKPTGDTTRVTRDEGPRESSIETLAGLKALAGDGGVHSAGSSSQISDGAAAMLLGRSDVAEALGVRPRAVIVDTTLVGVDPEMMLTGPIDVTHQLLERNNLAMEEIDVIEINEAFASVVLAWMREFKVDPDRVNPNGGAIALGHPLGATGVILLTKALNELERVGGRYGLVTMCCGGGLGTGTLIERV